MTNWLKKLLNYFLKAKPKPTPKPEPVKPEAIGGDHPTFVHTANGNAMWSGMVENLKILSFTFDDSGFWSHNDRSWPINGSNPQDGFICLIWDKGGTWHGEYWDCKVDRDYKYVSLRQHCLDPESPFAGRLPQKGQKVGNVFVSNDGSQRSNIAWGEWPL